VEEISALAGRNNQAENCPYSCPRDNNVRVLTIKHWMVNTAYKQYKV